MGIRRYIEIDTQRFSDSEKDPVQETADMKKPGYPGFFVCFRSSGQNVSAAHGSIPRGPGSYPANPLCAPSSLRTLHQRPSRGLRY